MPGPSDNPRPRATPTRGGVTGLALRVGRALVGRRFTDAIAELERAQWLSPDELRERSERRLASLLEHAARNVPFYRETYRELGLAADELRTIDDLRRLPVVDKAVFRSRPLEDFLAENVPEYRRLPYRTSGSTGEPFAFCLDRRAMPLVFASHLFYDSWYGLDPFDRCLRIMAPPAADPPVPKSAPLGFRARQAVAGRLQRLYERLTQRRVSTFDVTPERAEQVFREMEAFRPAYVLGYTSTLATLAAELERRGLRPAAPLKAVVTIAESLTPDRRRVIEDYFGAPIANRYGQRELKYWCAQSCRESPEQFHVNTELVAWETLRADGSPAGPGEVGRVVLTNLHNEAMPFIRYDTRDLAAVGGPACGCGRGFPVVSRLDGRSQECLTTAAGRMINPTSLGHYLFVVHDYIAEVRHFQLVQRTQDAVTLRIVPAGQPARDLTGRLAADLAQLVGAEVAVEVETVAEIPLERSGKRPIIKVEQLGAPHGAAETR